MDVLVKNTTDNPNVVINGSLTGTIEEEYSLSGENSKSPDGNSISSYLWEKVSGPSLTLTDSNKPIVKFNPNKSGTYKIKLTVTDDKNLNSSKEVEFIADSYKVNVKLIDPLLNFEGVSGLKVSLNNKSAFTNGNGIATLEYKTQAFSGNLTVDRTSEYYNIGKESPVNINVNGDVNYEEALLPKYHIDSEVYNHDLLSFMRAMNNDGNDVITVWQNLPIQVYKGNPPDSKFEEARVNAQNNWENKTFVWKGRTITPSNYFVDVDSDPSVGMKFEHNANLTQVIWEGDFGGERGHASDGTPRKAIIRIKPDESVRPLDNLTKLYEHEIHHVLHDTGLESLDRNHASNSTIDVHVSRDDSVLTTLMYKLTEFYKAKGKLPDLRIYS